MIIYAKPIDGEYGGNEYYKSKLNLSPQEIAKMSDEELINITMRSHANKEHKDSDQIDYTTWSTTFTVYIDSGNTNVLHPSPALQKYLNEKRKMAQSADKIQGNVFVINVWRNMVLISFTTK